MGTDIHCYVEIKFDRWNTIRPAEPCTYEPGGMVIPSEDIGRDYDLFAILAGVRNGYAFAGADTGDEFVPISEPKGLPEDISEELKNGQDGDDTQHPRCWLGDHSFSYLTLNEILQFDYTRTRKCRGVVHKKTWLKWRWHRGFFKSRQNEINHPPDGWCGDVSGRDVVIHSSDDAFEMFYQKLSRRDRANLASDATLNMLTESDKNQYARCQWLVDYAFSAKQLFAKIVPLMASHAHINKLSYDDVRIVFGFDS